ncbi:glycosyltransferase [Zavarzinia sp. CC-PAN008]|uniref:glycosyltransferase n=1 Tax=Zavarzinia sp. CC-PAN008 TaxID=3243332 RepID=UPI003F746500
MKIAYVLSPSCLYGNLFSGVVVQARCWAAGLRELGHQVDFPAAHQAIDWTSYDVVHLFQHGAWCDSLIGNLAPTRSRTVFSPIIDPPRPYGRLAGAVSLLPFERLRLAQNQRLLRLYGRRLDRVLARSRHEAESLRAVGVPGDRVPIVHIPMSKAWDIPDDAVLRHPRNGAILHVSSLSQPRKNVRTLVEIAMQEGFALRLAGSIGDPAFAAWLQSVSAAHPRIVYLGRIGDDVMLDEMLSCSAFCLPSLFEGVGLVALDAAYCGAHLVVTDRGGTPEYVGDTARIVTPADRDGIRDALKAALAEPGPNMRGRARVIANYSSRGSAENLVQTYQEIL